MTVLIVFLTWNAANIFGCFISTWTFLSHSRKLEASFVIFVLSEKIGSGPNNDGGYFFKKETVNTEGKVRYKRRTLGFMLRLAPVSHMMMAWKPLSLQSNAIKQDSVPGRPVTTTHKAYHKSKESRDVYNYVLNKVLFSRAVHLGGKPGGFDTEPGQKKVYPIYWLTEGHACLFVKRSRVLFSTIEKGSQTTKVKDKLHPHLLQEASEGGWRMGSCSLWARGTRGDQFCFYQMF